MQGDLTWTRLKTGSGFPKLKAKAAATRHMMSYGLHLAQTYLSEDRRIVAIAQLMAKFYSRLENEGPHLKQATIDRIMELGGEVCGLYANLSAEAKDARQKYWKVSPKMHVFLYLCEWCIPDSGLNPRFYWTYPDEDLVGALIEVAETCHVRTLAGVALTKWIVFGFDE